MSLGHLGGQLLVVERSNELWPWQEAQVVQESCKFGLVLLRVHVVVADVLALVPYFHVGLKIKHNLQIKLET